MPKLDSISKLVTSIIQDLFGILHVLTITLFINLLWKLPISIKLKNKIDNFYKNFKKSSQIALECDPGDLAIFDGRLLHSSSPKLASTPADIEKKLQSTFLLLEVN